MKNFSQFNDEKFLREWAEFHGNYIHYWLKIVLPLYLVVGILVRILIYGFHDILGLSFWIYIILFMIMATLITYHFNYKRHTKRYNDLKKDGRAD